MDTLALLRSTVVFGGLDEQVLAVMAGQLREVRCPAGTVVFREGDTAEAFYLVEQGSVAISKRIGREREKVLAVLGSGSVFGEMAFFSDSPRTADAVTGTEAVVWKIERADFMRFISGQPEAGLKVLSGLLQVSMDRLEQTSRELATVYQTGKIISSGRSLREILTAVQEEVLLAVPEAGQAVTYLYNEFNEEYEAAAGNANMAEVSRDHPLLEQLGKEPSGLIVNDAAVDGVPGSSVFPGARSLLLAPIIKGEQLLGFLALENTARTDVFRSNHRLLLSSVAGQLAEAVENIRHQQEERDRQRLNNARQSY